MGGRAMVRMGAVRTSANFQSGLLPLLHDNNGNDNDNNGLQNGKVG